MFKIVLVYVCIGEGLKCGIPVRSYLDGPLNESIRRLWSKEDSWQMKMYAQKPSFIHRPCQRGKEIR